MDISAEQKVQKARTQLMLFQPFFGVLLLKFPLVYTESVPTMGVDGKKIYINKGFVDTLTTQGVKTVLCHEILHIAFQHPLRGMNKEKSKWQVAIDYAVNCVLKEVSDNASDDKQKVDPVDAGGLYDPQWHGYSADQIYHKLPDQSCSQCGGSQGCQGGEDGQGRGQSQNGCEGCQGQGDTLIGPDMMEPNSGRGMSSAERKEIENEVKIALDQAAAAAKMQGNLPAGLQRIVDEITKPQLNWKELLLQFLTKKAMNDYSWRHPNKRYLSQNIILPGLYSEEMGKVAVGIDTSGSIGHDELVAFVSELNGILTESRPEKVTVYYWDVDVCNTEEFEPMDLPLVVNPKGGGGTDPAPMFEQIVTDGEDYEAIICFTDGYFNVNELESVDYPVMWILSSDGDHNFEPPFGDVIQIK